MRPRLLKHAFLLSAIQGGALGSGSFFGNEEANVDESDSFDFEPVGGPIVAAVAAGLLTVFNHNEQDDQLERQGPELGSSDDINWIASSKSWVDRTACRWLGFCGLLHLNKSHWGQANTRTSFEPLKKEYSSLPPPDAPDVSGTPHGPDQESPPDDKFTKIARPEIPSYVLEYAPLVFLHPEETYWPGHIAEHLQNTIPLVNYSVVPPRYRNPTLEDLSNLNVWDGHAYLQSLDNVEEKPEWLLGRRNIPVPVAGPGNSDPTEELDGSPHRNQRPWSAPTAKTSSTVPGRSSAPVPLVVVEKEDGIVDAFWWYFYSYNRGNSVFGIPFGNHVGDWEHMIVRFKNGFPTAVFYSQHENGKAYTYDAVEKIGKRPVGYSAKGTHAMYATAGLQPYVLPFNLLLDLTTRGPLWDPTLNMIAITYDIYTQQSRIVETDTSAPINSTSWFDFDGHWGDQTYRLDDPRQYRIAGQYHFVSGPRGPKQHWLERIGMCQYNKLCQVRDSI